MFIRCDSCGKLFNYEKNDGICPHCSAFNSAPDNCKNEPGQRVASHEIKEPQPFADEAETEESTFAPQPTYAPFQQEPALEEPRSRNKGCRGCGCIFGVLFVLFLAVIGVQIWQHASQKDRWMEQMQQTEAPLVQDFDAEQNVQIGMYTVCSADSAVIALPEGSAELPEGEMAVGIHLNVLPGDAPDSSDWYYSSIPAPYVMLEDGRCRKMMDVWMLSSYSSPLYAQCLDLDALYYGDTGSGMVYFVVPAGTDTVTLCLEERDPSSQSLVGIHELTLPVREVSE